MTRNQLGRSCGFAIVFGFVVGVGSELILVLAGVGRPRFLKLICVGASVVLCLGCRLVHERLFLRDYEKLAEARRRRMHW